MKMVYVRGLDSIEVKKDRKDPSQILSFTDQNSASTTTVGDLSSTEESEIHIPLLCISNLWRQGLPRDEPRMASK